MHACARAQDVGGGLALRQKELDFAFLFIVDVINQVDRAGRAFAFIYVYVYLCIFIYAYEYNAAAAIGDPSQGHTRARTTHAQASARARAAQDSHLIIAGGRELALAKKAFMEVGRWVHSGGHHPRGVLGACMSNLVL